MRKVYVFKNLGTGQVKNVLAEDGEGRTALDNALAVILDQEKWKPEDVKFQFSRNSLPTDRQP